MNDHDQLRAELLSAIALPWQPSFDGDLDYKSPPTSPKSQAAVMILINIHSDEPRFVLTQRTSEMRQHSGQVAFPGGRKDDTDPSLWDAALRETQEEIGLPLDHPLEPLGAISEHLTITSYQVTPFVALNSTPFAYIPEAAEVAEVFEVPLSLLKPENFEVQHQIWQGQKRNYFVLPYKDYFIWGATARILHQLASRLAHVRHPD